jgi:hypothetical protein
MLLKTIYRVLSDRVAARHSGVTRHQPVSLTLAKAACVLVAALAASQVPAGVSLPQQKGVSRVGLDELVNIAHQGSVLERRSAVVLLAREILASAKGKPVPLPTPDLEMLKGLDGEAVGSLLSYCRERWRGVEQKSQADQYVQYEEFLRVLYVVENAAGITGATMKPWLDGPDDRTKRVAIYWHAFKFGPEEQGVLRRLLRSERGEERFVAEAALRYYARARNGE